MRNFLDILLAIFIILTAMALLSDRSYCQNLPSFKEHPAHASRVILPSGGDVTTGTGDGHANIPTPPSQEPLGTAVKRLGLKPKHTPVSCQNVLEVCHGHNVRR